MKAIFWVVLVSILASASSLFAAEQEQIQKPSAFTLQELQTIANQPRWLRLLKYDTHAATSSKSAITNSAFFLSPAGQTNPLQELTATLTAFSAPPEQGDAHAQCRFPARYLFLKQQLNLNLLGIEQVYCPKYLEFSEGENAESISVIFATGYLGNPASYYGHMLVKINSGTQVKTTDLENTAVNFGANVPNDEGMLAYIAKGIFGGYDSSFTHQQYFYHSHNYGESELRDLWEYELDLSVEDRTLLIAHLWELMNADYTYYFFNRNCAYRIGELLELVIGNKLVDPWRPWETPQGIMQRFGDLSYNHKPLVKKIHYHPSRQSRLYQRYNGLSTNERDIVHELVKHPENIERNTLTDLGTNEQYKVLDTLLDYYQFVRKDKDAEKDINNENYREVLSKRYLLPPGESDAAFSSNNEPHLGRKPSYINIGITSNPTLGKSLNVWLRPAYYDSLDGGYGHIKNAALSMGELSVAINADNFYIRNLNLVKIESIRRNYTGLPGDRNSSWYLEVGAEQEWLNCNNCLATKVRSGYGYATSLLNDKVLLAGFVGGGFLGESINSTGLYISATTSANLNINDAWTLRAEAEQRHYKDRDDVIIYRATARWHFSPQMDARAHFSQDREDELGVSFGFYW